ncbi:A24 family peptidase [Streptomyces sp. 549]|uniref:A24 family peptidase n=1 Tax=Streptomyces sp. 549 TaxID=3049076 RepID=UPI0024C3A42B|nr:A24 family peptidase [Streptomyces sp. 549]MDK1476607.1 A24 family peptidase [Streptomyces sp. 549]
MGYLLTVLAAVYGAVAGLLLPRAGYRLAVESGAPWLRDCPAGHRLSGWVGGNRCGPCEGARYGPSATRCAVLTAAVCAVLAAAVGPRPELAVWLVLVPGLLLLALVDRAVHRLPDVLTLPLGAVCAVLLGAAWALPGSVGDWPRALLAGLILAAGYFVLFLISPRGMGFGDVKLALPVGVALGWYGWDVVLTGTFAGFVLGAGYGLWQVGRGRATRRTAMPFGPFMVAGALAALALGGLSG